MICFHLMLLNVSYFIYQVFLCNINILYLAMWFKITNDSTTYHHIFNIYMWFIDLTRTGNTNLVQSESLSNSNEVSLYISQRSRLGAPPTNAVECHTKVTRQIVFLPLYSAFYSPSRQGVISLFAFNNIIIEEERKSLHIVDLKLDIAQLAEFPIECNGHNNVDT